MAPTGKPPAVVSINLSTGGIPKLPVPGARLTPDGFAGDGRDHAKHEIPTRAVSLLDEEVMAEIRNEGYDVCPGAMGENLTVRGLDVQSLCPGTRLRFAGGAEIELVEPRKPCFVLDAIDPSLKDAVVGRIGYMARVVTPGTLEAGAEIAVLPAGEPAP